jgi:hypothetical protein
MAGREMAGREMAGREMLGRWQWGGNEVTRKWQGDGTWMDAPAAYQKGPEIPKFHATLDDWRRVAAHVHCDTMTWGGCLGGAAVRQNPRHRHRDRDGTGTGIKIGVGVG